MSVIKKRGLLGAKLLGLLLTAGLLLPVGTATAASGTRAIRDTSNQCDKLSAIDYTDWDLTVTQLRSLFQKDDFARLEEALTCLMESKQRFQSGKPGASAVYWLFRNEMHAPGPINAAAAHVGRWQHELPNSIFAEFGDLRIRYVVAWNSRGNGYARDVTLNGMEGFQQGLHNLEVLLLQTSSPLKNTPIWHNLLLAVAQDSGSATSPPAMVFQDAVQRSPGYYDFYEVRLSRLVPRWGGSWESVDKFIKHWSAERNASEGKSMYARLYTSVIVAGADTSETLIDWSRMKPSLEDLVARYPTRSHKNLAASFACRFGDKVYLKMALGRLKERDLDTRGWLPGMDQDRCEQWLATQTAKG